MTYTPTPERIQRATENVDVNTKMFEGYGNSDDVVATLARLRSDRVELEELAAGKRTYDTLSYSNKERFFDMPAWGTRGT